MKDGYPPVIIKAEDRANYYDALDMVSMTGDYDDFIVMIRDALHRTLDLYLDLIS